MRTDSFPKNSCFCEKINEFDFQIYFFVLYTLFFVLYISLLGN